MIPWKHQTEIANQAIEIIKNHMIVYLAMEERTGKSLTSLLIAEGIKVERILILTKKKALEDWDKLLEAADLPKHYFAINYHQAYKIKGQYDLVILDESHNYISSYPKIGATAAQLKVQRKKGLANKNIYNAVKRLCHKKPLIYLSATPYAQGPQLLYHQMSVSSWSPWLKYPSFYSWFRQFGKPYTIELRGREVNQYDRCHDDLVVGCVNDFFIAKTRKELGFEQEPVDIVHYITLSDRTRAIYNELIEEDIVFLDEWVEPLVCDTTTKLRFALHMLEGGTAKIENNYTVLRNNEKITFIKDKWGDTSDLVIMYNYKAELIKLSAHFKKAKILQATSYAEGVDLSMDKDMVIYSQDFSTARHTQRRARQCNMNRVEPINIHHLLVKKAISAQVFKIVAKNKKNFVDSVFDRSKI